MRYLSKQAVMRAFDVGVDSFVKALNKELEVASREEQGELLPSKDTIHGQHMKELIAFYITKYRENPLYGERARPDVGDKAQGVLKRLLKQYNVGQVKKLIEVYLQLDDEWFKTQYHNLVTLEAKLQRVLYSATTGNRSTEKTNLERANEKLAAEERGKIAGRTTQT